MSDILNDLGKLKLGERQILGDRKNVEDAIRRAQNDAATTDKPSGGKSDVIEISSGSELDDDMPPPFLASKAQRLVMLTKRVPDATNNLALSGIVREFIEVLQCNSSRILTNQAFHFLDVLHKQLADPSVFMMPMRYVPIYHCVGLIRYDRLTVDYRAQNIENTLDRRGQP